MAREIPKSESLVTERDLPTTLAIAQQGARDFAAIISALPKGKVRGFFLRDNDIRLCFLGAMPNVDYTRPEPNVPFPYENSTFLATISQIAPGIFSFHAPAMSSRHNPAISFLNLRAAEHIIKNHSDSFPKSAQLDPKSWVSNNPNLWKSDDEMHGLLSGIPAWDIKPYIICSSAMDRFRNAVHEANSEYVIKGYQLFAKRRFNTIERSPEVTARVGLFIETMVSDITPLEKDLILKGAANPRGLIGCPEFVGFDARRDAEYQDMLSELYLKSGIKDTA